MVKKPTLILSPDGSWDANGRVEPSIGGGVIVVPGQYGNAWQVFPATTNLFPNPALTTTAGMTTSGGVVINVIAPPAGVGLPADLEGTVTTIGRSTVGSTTSSHLNLIWTYPELTLTAAVHTYSVYLYIPSTWAGSNLSIRTGSFFGISSVYASLDMAKRDEWQRVSLQVTPAAGDLSGSFFLQAANGGVAGQMVYFAGIQVEPGAYATPFAHGDMGTGHAWTGTPHASASTRVAGSVSATLATAPQSVLVRYSEDGGTTHLDEHRIGAGTFGTKGDITYSGGAMTVAPSSGSVQVESVLIFDTALSDAEIAEYMAMQDWQVLNPYAGNARIPYRSSMLTFEREVFIADGNNNIIEDITPLVRSVITDIDAARADSKVEATIETYTDPIADGDWVSIYHTLTPEQGDIVRRQRCLVRVETPRIQYTGGGEEIGMSTGRDIIRDLAMATLDIPFYTPNAGMIMPDVEAAIRMLGITSMGPNRVGNHSFEDGLTFWTRGGTGTESIYTASGGGVGGAPDGKQSLRLQQPGGTPYTSNVYCSQPITTAMNQMVAAGVKNLFVSAFVYTYSNLASEHQIQLSFTSASGNVWRSSEGGYQRTGNGWQRIYGVIDIPEEYNGVTATVYTVTRPRSTHSPLSGTTSVEWDDVQVRAVTGDLLPASMLALPQSTLRASSRIQNNIGDHILEAVDVRLKAIGIHPPYTTPDGRPTSRPILASEQDTASRSYDIDDDRIADTVRIEASPSERANKVMAVKEVHDAPPLVATVYNRNPDDPYSLENYPPRGVRISMYDAVDVDALRAAALDELSRRVVRDEISFKIMPDPDINIHDVIEVTGPPTDRRVGRWIIIAIRDGSSGSNPAMEILARRVSLGEWS